MGRRAAPFLAALPALLAAAACADIFASAAEDHIVWQVHVSGGQGVPSHDSTAVFAMSTSHELLAIQKATGRIRWRARSGNTHGNTRGWGTALAADVVVMSDGGLYAFDRHTGAERWSFVPPEGFPGYSLVAADSASIYVGSATHGRVWALEAASGAVRWARQLDAGREVIAWDPVVREGVIYVGLERFAQPRTGGIVALDAATGAERWRRELTPSAPGRGAGGTGPVAIAGDLVVVAANDGTLWALARADGSVRWTAPPPARLMTADDIRPLAIVGDIVVAASTNEEISGYTASTGRLVWTVRPRVLGSVWGWLTTDGVHVYAQGSGRMAKIDQAGRIQWIRGGINGAPCFQQGAVVDSSRVYSSGCAAIYAIRK